MAQPNLGIVETQMRRVLALAFVAAVSLAVLPDTAQAQSRPQEGGQNADGSSIQPRQRARTLPLGRQANAGPCPIVRVLYDAARYVELADAPDRVREVYHAMRPHYEHLHAHRLR